MTDFNFSRPLHEYDCVTTYVQHGGVTLRAWFDESQTGTDGFDGIAFVPHKDIRAKKKEAERLVAASRRMLGLPTILLFL